MCFNKRSCLADSTQEVFMRSSSPLVIVSLLSCFGLGCPPAADQRNDPVPQLDPGPAKEPIPEVCDDPVLMAPLAAEQSNYSRAFARYVRLEEKYRSKIQERDLVAAYDALVSMGRLSMRRLRKPDVAIAHFGEARTLATQLGAPAKEADALLYAGQAQLRRTLYSDALTTLGQAQAMYKKLNMPVAESRTMAMVGLVYFHLKNQPKAVALVGQAENNIRAIHSEERLARMAQGRALMAIGGARNAFGELKRAEDAFQEALAAFVGSSDFREQALALEEIAEIHVKAGNHEKAAAYFQEAYAVWSKVGHTDGQADTLLDLGDELFALGQKDLALTMYTKARALYEQIGQEGDSSAALGRMGRAYAALGQKAQAFASFFQALSLARASHRPTRLASVLHDVSATYSTMGDYDHAVRCSQRAFQFWQELGEQDEAVQALTEVGDNYLKLGDLRGARDNYDRALGICRALTDLSCEVTLRKRLDQAH